MYNQWRDEGERDHSGGHGDCCLTPFRNEQDAEFIYSVGGLLIMKGTRSPRSMSPLLEQRIG